MKIYTKTGDKGKTGLFSGDRVPKNSSYIEAYGDVDELNAFLGSCITACDESELKEELVHLQNDLHRVCADLATPLNSSKEVARIVAKRTKRLEESIDKFEEELEPLKEFILAGGCELASRIHIARVVSRRVERRVVSHSQAEDINEEVIVYLNRLSDFLFVLARVANKRASVKDVPWNQSL